MKKKSSIPPSNTTTITTQGATYGPIVGRDMKGTNLQIGSIEEKPSKKLEEADQPKQIPILFLGANPADTTRLHLDQEVRAVDEALRRAELREVFDLRQSWAVQAADLQDCLLRHEPRIVHFSGHGEIGSLLLEDGQGGSQPIPASTLTRLFRMFRRHVRCVVLNCCCSMEQAKAIAVEVECVVGMSQPITDLAALAFAAGFYRSLAAGRNLQAAFEHGCIEVELRGAGDGDVPEIICERSDPGELVLV